jgi:hypothetical protein
VPRRINGDMKRLSDAMIGSSFPLLPNLIAINFKRTQCTDSMDALRRRVSALIIILWDEMISATSDFKITDDLLYEVHRRQ